MSKKRLWSLLATIVLPYIGMLSYTGISKTANSPLHGFILVASALFILTSCAMLIDDYQKENDPEHPIRLSQRWSYFLAIFAWCALPMFDTRQYYYPGGDVDPVAYLQQKTKYRGGYHLLEETGGYHLLADTNTYRTFIGQGPYVQLPYPLSRYRVASHIPSIIEIKEYKVSMSLPHTKRDNECALSLLGAVVHIPFDEVRVGRYLKQLNDRWSTDPVFDITQKLERVFDPIFKSVTEPLPEGTIFIDLDVTDGILGHLEEQYGFRIVAPPGNTPSLKCTIKYVGDPPVNDQIQLLQGQTVRMSNINELFPPRKKAE